MFKRFHTFLDFYQISLTFPPKILGGFPRKTTLRELAGSMGLEHTDCIVFKVSGKGPPFFNFDTSVANEHCLV